MNQRESFDKVNSYPDSYLKVSASVWAVSFFLTGATLFLELTIGGSGVLIGTAFGFAILAPGILALAGVILFAVEGSTNPLRTVTEIAMHLAFGASAAALPILFVMGFFTA